MNKVYPSFLQTKMPNGNPYDSFFHIIPVPYEANSSDNCGTNLGPLAVLEASTQLELWEGKSRPADLGIHTMAAVDCTGEFEDALKRIGSKTRAALKQGHFPIVLGGEHVVTRGGIKGFLEAGYTQKGKPDIGVVQLSAYAGLRDVSAMKCIVEEGVPLYQLGVRALCDDEVKVREDFGIIYQDADELVSNNVQSITLPDDFPRYVFFTLSIDGIDPSVFPSTRSPVPGGLSWYQSLNIFECIAKQRKIVGFDIMDFAPIEGFQSYDFAAAMLIYKMMGIVQRHR